MDGENEATFRLMVFIAFVIAMVFVYRGLFT